MLRNERSQSSRCEATQKSAVHDRLWWSKRVFQTVLFLHQTTTSTRVYQMRRGCILFYFYIKPQLFPSASPCTRVVSYSISTSNHNLTRRECGLRIVVSYSISTSNHNYKLAPYKSAPVVSYSISTSNHNVGAALSYSSKLYLILFLHQTTTPSYTAYYHPTLYLILFLHQTTTDRRKLHHRTQLYLILFLHQTTTHRMLSNDFQEVTSITR